MPRLYILDNEASLELKASITLKKPKYQLVPLHIHYRNAAERAIRTRNNYFFWFGKYWPQMTHIWMGPYHPTIRPYSKYVA